MYNSVDLVIALIIALYMVRGYQRGVWPLLARLIAFVAALVLAFWGYQQAGNVLQSYWSAMPSITYAVGFIALFTVGQFAAFSIVWNLFALIPEQVRGSLVSKVLGIVPAFVDGVIFVGLLILMVIVLPVPTEVRDRVTESRTGTIFVAGLQTAEGLAQRAFGSVIEEALTYFTTRPDSSESVSIPYKPKSLSVDETAEAKMLELVNAERAKVGAPELAVDPVLTSIAREHSRDMWERGYFSHTNPDGAGPFDRMRDGGAKFVLAGENLAFAPTVGLAHRGLMNSPGHKRNILDPKFGRVGIGVMDGGIYGKMYTQNFAE